MQDCKRLSRSTTSLARRDAPTLDVIVIPDCSLSDLLLEHGLMVTSTASLTPEQFLAQSLRPHVHGIYVDRSSAAPVHAAHRLVSARTQSRGEIPPGGCMLRGETARRDWTLAIPPLLTYASDLRAPAASATQKACPAETDEACTRIISFLSHSESVAPADDEEPCFSRRPVHAKQETVTDVKDSTV
jgi:hypothetical protein